MVHVLHVVRTLGKAGGMERNLARVIRALHHRGIRHSIALLSDWPEILDFGEMAPIRRLVTPPGDPRLILLLRNLIRELEPTVIHARNWGAWPDVALARQTLRHPPPLIWSYHGMEAAASITVKQRLGHQGLAALTDRIFAVSDAARRVLTERFGVKAHVDVIPNGVDSARFHPAEGLEAGGPVVVGSSGRLHSIKNFAMLVRAVGRLKDRHPELRVRIAGEGPLRASLTALAEEVGVAHRLELPGFVDDMPAFLRGLSIFALTSHLEANPNALLEALATGLPSVATEVGGCVEVTDHGRVAHLVPPDDDAALAEALGALLAAPEQRRAWGRRARAWILERYDQSGMMDAYEALYRHPVPGGAEGR